MSDQGKGRKLEVVAWEGEVDGNYYRVVGHDDSYGGTAWAIEWAAVDPETLETIWEAVSYGDEADAPECASVAAHIAAALDQAEAQEIRLTESLAESETELREAEHRLGRVRGVVRAAVRLKEAERAADEAMDRMTDEEATRLHHSDCVVRVQKSWQDLYSTLDALLPEDREWAEG